MKMELNLESEDAFTSALSCAISKQCFSYIMYLSKQVEAMRELFHCNDVFLWLTTEYGKSVCYQAMPFLLDVKLELQPCHLVFV